MLAAALFTPLFWLTAALPSGNQLTPERLLSPAEFVLVSSVAGSWSNATKLPTGGTYAERYSEAHFNLNLRVGIAKFLTAELNVPLLTAYQLDSRGLLSGNLGTMRVGDPTFGLLFGHGFRSAQAHGAALDVAAVGELQAPSDGNITLRLRDNAAPSANNFNRGAVITTGGVTAKVGAMVGGSVRLTFARVGFSSRGYYRIRSNGASDGVGFDLRLRSLWADHVILAATVSGMFAISGSNRGYISASREGDGASWLDLGAVVGWRAASWVDVLAAFVAPVYSASSGQAIQIQLAVEFRYQPLL